jgi:hypothetical protein
MLVSQDLFNDAEGGIRTHGLLRERILSPPPLSKLGHLRDDGCKPMKELDTSEAYSR